MLEMAEGLGDADLERMLDMALAGKGGGRTRALAPLNALVHALLAEAVSPSFWQSRPYGAEDARSHEAGARNRVYLGIRRVCFRVLTTMVRG